jgi:hypothetical protein
MRNRSHAVLPIAVAAVLAACGSSAGSPRVTTRNLPSGADVAVIRVDTRGGLTSPETQLAIVPELSVFGDGRVIVTGPVTEQYPQHALPNLLTGRLPAGILARWIGAASRAGLTGKRVDFGQPGVTDLPTTTVTFTSVPPCPPESKCGYAHTVQSAYALSFTLDGAEDQQLTAAQRDARHRLTAFIRTMQHEAVRVATGPYPPSEIAVYVAPAADGDTGGVRPGRADWPLGNLATIGSHSSTAPVPMPSTRCAVLTGADARVALAAAASASAITRWRSAGADYTIVWRPLLPDEHACP